MRRVLVAGLGITLLAGAGCTSTQEKADRLAAKGRQAFTERGVRVSKQNPAIRVLDTAVLSDENGSAAVVVLESRARRAQARLPIAIDVRGGGRKTVFRNDAPGLEPSLTGLTVITAGRRSIWVNDQVTAAGTPRDVVARVGLPRGRAPRKIPVLRVGGVRLAREETTGLYARGAVRNESAVEQRDLVLYGVARRGKRIVAAGRAQVRRVRPRGRESFRMFFIGDPRRAELSISVPPTRLEN